LGEPLRCPYCAGEDHRVIDSRDTDAGQAIRRRRACPGCGQRFSTVERAEQRALCVRKRGGGIEPFDRDKLAAGMRKAATNLPIGAGRLNRAVAQVEARLQALGRREVDSAAVGAEVLAALRALDPVAYMRFASVYKGFTTPEDFRRELAGLDLAKPARPAGP
jgi:transcriptional repressor NrdR